MNLLGVNLAGADFGSVGQAYGTGYTYPTHAEIDYYAAQGMNVIRLPFLWERLQPTLNGALDKAELARIDDVVGYATSKGLKVDLDVHNYGKFNGQLIGSAAVPTSAFANLWGQIAGHFASNPNVIFGLMNEPQVSNASDWVTSVNAAIGAIRSTGAAQEVLVPGINWDGAWTWAGTPNASVIGTGVVDPLKNYALEVHQYLDGNGSGTTSDVASAQTGVDRLQSATQWAEQTGNKLFLGEFGVATDKTSLAALNNMLAYMNQHTSAWQGATYWAGGPWWGGSNIYGIEPTGLGTSTVIDQPQMAILKAYESVPANGNGSGPASPPASATPVDPGPTVGKVGNPRVLEAGQSETVATVAPGSSGQTVALRQTGGTGTLSLGAVQADGTSLVTYTAPASVGSSAADAPAFVLTDMQSGATTSATISIGLDPGPQLASMGAGTVGAGKTVTVGTVTPGLSGDTLSLTLTGTPPVGTLSLSGTNVLYTAPTSIGAVRTDSFSYRIVDQHNDAAATGAASVTLTPAPTAASAVAVAAPAVAPAVVTAPAIVAAPAVTLASLATASVATPAVTASSAHAVGPAAASIQSFSGYNNSITFGDGSYAITAGFGSARVSLGNGNDTVALGGYNNAVAAGNGDDTVTGGAGNSTIALGNGNDHVTTSGYSNRITVGSGSNTIVAGGGSETVTAGAGTDVVALAGYGNVVTLNGSHATVSGSQGNDAITANDGSDTFTEAGYGNHLILNGTISADITDVGHGLQINIGSSTQHDTIAGFGADGSGLIGIGTFAGYADATAVVGALHTDGHGGTMLALGTSGLIDFVDTPQALLHASNFRVG